MPITSDILLEAYLSILDRAQAYEICIGVDNLREDKELPHSKELQKELTKLYRIFHLNDEITLTMQLKKVNELLDNLIFNSTSTVQTDITRFIRERRKIINLNKEIKKILLEEADRFNNIVTFVNYKSNIQVTQKQHTKDGKLIKEHACIVCSIKFNSNRKNAKYCSDKCKQAAYRERKETH